MAASESDGTLSGRQDETFVHTTTDKVAHRLYPFENENPLRWTATHLWVEQKGALDVTRVYCVSNRVPPIVTLTQHPCPHSPDLLVTVR